MDERELREEEILRQAAKVFKEKGYHGASVQDIADAVGMQKGSLYYHIESKEDLLFRVMDRGMGTVLAPLEEVARLNESPVAKLRLAVENHVRLLTQNLDALTVVLQDHKAVLSARRQPYLARRKRFEELLRQIIAEGVASGAFRPVDVRLATLAILGMCNWLVIWYQPGRHMSPDEIAAGFADLALHSLLAAEATATPP